MAFWISKGFEERPTTASLLKRNNSQSSIITENISIVRPGTSSGRRHLVASSLEAGINPDIGKLTNNDILQIELDKDNLLRIRTAEKTRRENEAFFKVESGDLEGLKKLISEGLEVSNCRGFSGHSLLHQAANKGYVQIVSELFRFIKDPNLRNDSNETPLHLAVYSGQILAVDQLLDFGADINAVNNDHETCLFYAARRSMSAIIRLLIQRGIDVNIRDRYDELAIDHASSPHVLKAFQHNYSGLISEKSNSTQIGNDKLTHDDLLIVFSFLSVHDILKAACVCSKWHRVSETESLWKALGVRKWELALQNSLGFNPTPTSSFFRPNRASSKNRKTPPNQSTNLIL